MPCESNPKAAKDSLTGHWSAVGTIRYRVMLCLTVVTIQASSFITANTNVQRFYLFIRIREREAFIVSPN